MTGMHAGTGPGAAATFSGGRGIVLESLLLAAVALFFLNFNPFGALSVGHRYSQDLVYAWFGQLDWLFPRVPAGAPREAAARPRVERSCPRLVCASRLSGLSATARR